MNKYRKQIKPKNKYREFLKVLNGNLHLTDRELEILSLLMKIDEEWVPVLDGEIKNVISTDTRKAIMRETRVNKNNLTRYVGMLKEKGLLITTEDNGIVVSPMFMPKETGKIIEIVFTLDMGK